MQQHYSNESDMSYISMTIIEGSWKGKFRRDAVRLAHIHIGFATPIPPISMLLM